MKKNFLKKLAFTMAFATAFTALSPAAGVFAAAKPSLTVGKTLTLLLGTEREEHDINVKNKVAGSKYAWSSSNKAIATVDSKGVVEGQKVGSAKVTLKITLPTKKTQTLTTNVDVKDNISQVRINNADKLPAALGIGEEFDFNRTIVSTQGGNTKPHKGAITRWEVTGENATINDSGVFVATAPGEYEVVAISFQSKAKYNQYLANKEGNANLVTAKSEPVKVVVANSVDSVNQYDLNSVVFAFKSAITEAEFKAGDVHINYVIGDVKIQEQKVKSTKVSADGKTVTVALYDPFISEGNYAVTYDGKDVATFKAAKIAPEEVVSIKFATDAQITVNDEKALEVNLYNKDGVIINQPSSTATAGLKARVEYKQEVNTSYLANLLNDKLTIFKKDDIATITAIFHTYTYDSYKENVFTDTKTFVGVDKPSDTAKEVLTWTISDLGKAPDWKKAPKFVAVDDVAKRLYVEVLLQDGTTKYNNNSDPEGKIRLTSSNSAILFVDELGTLNAVREGEVIVTVEYNKLFVGSFKVVVSPKRVATALTLDTTNAVLSNATGLGDSVTVKATLVDQYGNAMANSEDLTVSASPVANANFGGIVSYDKNKITFNAEGAAKGYYSFTITHPSSSTLSRVFSLQVQEPIGGAVTWRLDMKAEHDLKITKAEDVAKVQDVALYGYASNGVKVTKESTATGFSLEVVNPDNKPYDEVSGNFAVDLITTSGTSVSGSTLIELVQKAKTGTYTVTAYKGTGSSRTAVARGAFKVVDTQTAPVFTVKKFETTAVDKHDAVAQAFTVKLHDNTVTPSKVEITGSNVKTRIRIDNVTVNETFGPYVLEHKLPIGYFVTVSPEFIY